MRVPFADVGPAVIAPALDVAGAVLLTDALPTGAQAAEMELRGGGQRVFSRERPGPMGLAAGWRHNRAGFIRKAPSALPRPGIPR